MTEKSSLPLKAATLKPALSLSKPGLLQRTCECGGEPGFTGKCETCASHPLRGSQPSLAARPQQPAAPLAPPTSTGFNFANLALEAPSRSPIQAKLTIGQPNDRYEQEADRVAAQVVNQINTPQPAPSPTVQRQEPAQTAQLQLQTGSPSSSAGMPATPELETEIGRSRGTGQPLAATIQTPMERAFGADFSQVRVHTGAVSDQLNRSIQARAFTTGSDVFFRQGTYQPGSRAGQTLIAHELTHVLHQGAAQGGRYQPIQRSIYHDFDQTGSLVKWHKSAKELYSHLRNWLEANALKEGILSLQSAWGGDDKSRKKIISIIENMMGSGVLNKLRPPTLVREALHFSTALSRRDHRFVDEENAIRAILAEGYRKQATQKEGELAKAVMDSAILPRLKSAAQNIRKLPVYKEYQKQIKGEYTHYMRKGLSRKVEIDEVLDKSNDFKKLISAIHDITSFLHEVSQKIDKNEIKPLNEKILHLHNDRIKEIGDIFSIKSEKDAIERKEEDQRSKGEVEELERLQKLYEKKNGEIKEKNEKIAALKAQKETLENKTKPIQEAVIVPDNMAVSSYSHKDSSDQTHRKTEKIDQVRPKMKTQGKAENASYISETSEVMKQVRENKMLVEVGPSYTTARLMQLCKTAGCDDEEMISVALGIFAFWNKDYWKSTSGIHRFHFVMDMCKNYVPALNYNVAYPESIKDLAPFLYPEPAKDLAPIENKGEFNME